jgi:5-methylcytosine-specific restriction enzyme A
MTVMTKTTTTRKWQHLYGSGRWRKRARHQMRSSPLCEMCKAEGRLVPAEIADHVEPHHGDVIKFYCGKLSSLCKHCHDSRKRRIETRGYDPTIGVDGKPVDKRHPYWTGVLPPSSRRTRRS